MLNILFSHNKAPRTNLLEANFVFQFSPVPLHHSRKSLILIRRYENFCFDVFFVFIFAAAMWAKNKGFNQISLSVLRRRSRFAMCEAERNSVRPRYQITDGECEMNWPQTNRGTRRLNHRAARVIAKGKILTKNIMNWRKNYLPFVVRVVSREFLSTLRWFLTLFVLRHTQIIQVSLNASESAQRPNDGRQASEQERARNMLAFCEIL